MSGEEIWFLVALVGVVGTLLVLDLGFVGRRSETVPWRTAVIWTAVWIASALAFNLAILPLRGAEKALQFLTGYLIELSLSVDNLFVFLLLFSSFAVPPRWQRGVLFWGVFGAIVLRVAMIAAGSTLIDRFHWILYLFGVFLALTGIRMLLRRKDTAAPGESRVMRWLHRCLPVSNTPHDGRFFVRIDGRLMVTPLFTVLLAVETADLMFAVDSVPAIFAVTTDPFIVASSNIFAILGLRSMYFALSGFAERLRYLKYGLAAVLIFVGAKILLAGIYPLPAALSLAITVGILAVAVTASLIKTKRDVEGSGGVPQ